MAAAVRDVLSKPPDGRQHTVAFGNAVAQEPPAETEEESSVDKFLEQARQDMLTDADERRWTASVFGDGIVTLEIELKGLNNAVVEFSSLSGPETLLLETLVRRFQRKNRGNELACTAFKDNAILWMELNSVAGETVYTPKVSKSFWPWRRDKISSRSVRAWERFLANEGKSMFSREKMALLKSALRKFEDKLKLLTNLTSRGLF